MLRWLHRAPEEFLTGPVVDVGDVRLPEAGPDSRLRWNLSQLHSALNDQRRERHLTWAQFASDLDRTANRLTNLRTARLAEMNLAMRITQRLRQPADHPRRVVPIEQERSQGVLAHRPDAVGQHQPTGRKVHPPGRMVTAHTAVPPVVTSRRYRAKGHLQAVGGHAERVGRCGRSMAVANRARRQRDGWARRRHR